MAKKKMAKKKIKPPTDVSFGLFELAARSCGFSQFEIMGQLLGPEAAERSARGFKRLTKSPKKGATRRGK